MKKILFLTTCLLSGLMAAEYLEPPLLNPLGANRNAMRAECYNLMAQYSRVAMEITSVSDRLEGDARIFSACMRNADLRKFYASRNPDHMELRFNRIMQGAIRLEELRQEKLALFETIANHPAILTVSVRGYIASESNELFAALGM